jgi:hypothetical protein
MSCRGVTYGQVLIRHNCVFDASLVPETCPNGFVDSRELINQVYGESCSRKLARPKIPLYENPVYQDLCLNSWDFSANPKRHNRPDSTTEAVGCIFAEASWKYWIGTILLGLELTNLRAERRTIEDSIEDWWVDLNLLDLAAIGVANLRFRT